MQNLLANLPRAETADRSLLIGASEVAAVLGLNPYRTAFGVWASKVDPQEREESDILDRGNFLESGVIRWAAKRMEAVRIEDGIPLDQPGILASSCVSVRPDAVLHFADRPSVLVEAKTSDVDGYDEDNVPEYTRIQALCQLAAVPDLLSVVVPAYLPIRRKFVMPMVERDDKLIARILELVNDWFYAHLDPHGPQTSPALDASDEACEYLKRRNPTSKGPLREGTLAEANLAIDYARAKAAAKAATEAATTLGNELRAAIGDDEGLQFGDAGKVSYKTQAGARRLDSAMVKANYPDIATACTVQGASLRVLRLGLKGLKDD
jgi:predicted phage-related endonuclease